VPAIAYTVTATLPDEATRDEYIAWLEDGHLDQVVRHGAHSAMAVSWIDSGPPFHVETRYIFATRELFDRYTSEAAPALRADGLRRFPPERGVSFERRVGVVL